MKRPLACLIIMLFTIVFVGAVFAEEGVNTDPNVDDRIEKDYLDLIDSHVNELTKEYDATSETEGLLVRRAVKNYITADLVDYTLLIFMAKYNVATGGIDMKQANAQIINTLRQLSDSANSQMLENLNALRAEKGLPLILTRKEAAENIKDPNN